MTTLPEAEPLIQRVGDQLRDLLAERGSEDPLLVGILTGGLWVAEHLALPLSVGSAVGALDVGFHRDDFEARGLPERIRPTRLITKK